MALFIVLAANKERPRILDFLSGKKMQLYQFFVFLGFPILKLGILVFSDDKWK